MQNPAVHFLTFIENLLLLVTMSVHTMPSHAAGIRVAGASARHGDSQGCAGHLSDLAAAVSTHVSSSRLKVASILDSSAQQHCTARGHSNVNP